jgi:TRAP-type mannitol/chloroaromatic compound transport system permease small subunit
MKKFVDFLDSISEFTGKYCAWTVVVLMLLVVFEVIMRRFLNSPTIWSFEITIQLYAFLFMITAAYGLLHDSHVSVDIVYERFGARPKAVLDVISYLIFFYPFMIVLLVKSIPYVSKSWAVYEKSWSAFAPPLYPIKTVIPITVILLLLQGTSKFIRQLHMAIKGEAL